MTYENQVVQNNLISLATQDDILNQSMCDKKKYHPWVMNILIKLLALHLRFPKPTLIVMIDSINLLK